MPPINRMTFHNDDETDETSEESVVTFTPPPAPASDEPSPPQLNQPPLRQTKSFEKFSIELRKRMARLANEIIKLTGCVHLGIPLKEPGTGQSNVELALVYMCFWSFSALLNPIFNFHFQSIDYLGNTHPSTSTSGLHPNKKAKNDPLAQAIGEAADSRKEFSASEMKLQLRGEEVLAVVSKIPNLSRLQVLKAVHILLNTNPEEFFLLKYLPDDEKTEWILLLISQS
ncbi:uncharacterized protein Pyn_32449 [Prunus yedoensis var. nudiflora]|uniref:Uncharacterized protein n=1 Tax=Prunus yedoensis var. nudiflora TaxID=2094558 RepID=A0A314ZJS5_PRUYE|nr:uncharacterized protein Pyn_32449 [Prunus yedoensis var. nudiflora]